MKAKLWKGTLGELIELAKKDPAISAKLSANAAKRIVDRLESYGVEEKTTLSGEKILVYKYLQEKVFGQETVIFRLINTLKGMASSSPIGRPFIVLNGPPGGGKSTIVELIRKVLNGETAYRIDGCPWNENPLKAIPEEEREKLATELGMPRAPLGKICARCRKYYGEEDNGEWTWDGEDWRNLPVSEYSFMDSVVGSGILGTTDNPTDVDLSKLVGCPTLSKATQLEESDPDGWDKRQGMIFRSNNGLLEIREIFKLPADFYKPFSSICQEAEIDIPKLENFVGLDVVIIGHTNDPEYQKSLSNPSLSWLRDRLKKVDVPYVLNYKEEAKIYRKEVEKTNFKVIHKARDLYEEIAKLSVGTRIVPDEKIKDLEDKIKIYAGEKIEDIEDLDINVKDLIAFGQNKNEGMAGMSPRTIINLMKYIVLPKTKNCLFILDLFEEAEKYFASSEDPTKKDRVVEINERIPKLISDLKKSCKEKIYKDVVKCFLYEHLADLEDYFKIYIQAAKDFKSNKKSVSDEQNKRDEKFMRRIEEKCKISESGKKEWRMGILADIAILKSEELNDFPKIKKAIEDMVLEDLQEEIRITLISERVDEKGKQRERRDALTKQLIEMGYCESCTKRAVEIAANILRENS